VFTRLLVGTDLTSQSAGAFRLAARMAAPGARLFAVHVLAMPPALTRWKHVKLSDDISSYRELLDRQIDGARRALDQQLAELELDDLVVEPLMRDADPPARIAEAADRHRAEVILVGRGAGGRLGATAEAVVRMTGRAVLVAPVPRPSRKRRALPTSHQRRRRMAA